MTRVEEVTVVDRRWRTELGLTVRGAGASACADQVAQMHWEITEQVERAASRFQANSELSGVNARPGHWVQISPLLGTLIDVALVAAEQTDGLVTPCLADHVDSAGYATWRLGQPAPALVTDAGPVSDWREIERHADRVRIPVGCSLDLGATAKAWLADELVDRVVGATGFDALAAMGGDLAARGPWVVGVDHDLPGMATTALQICDSGLATSGQGRRRWATSTGSAHHLIDPRTGRSSVSRWWSVSVLASSATAANVAATAALISDASGPAWLADRQMDALLSAPLVDPQSWGVRLAPAPVPVRQVRVGRWPHAQAVAA